VDSPQPDYDETLSRAATRSIFAWTLMGEGTRKSDSDYWKHEWLHGLLSAEEPEGESDSIAASLEHDRIYDWLFDQDERVERLDC